MLPVNNQAIIADYNPYNYALPKFPNDITLLILRKLENLMDIKSFGATSHTAQIFTQVIWSDWAEYLGYEGSEDGSLNYLSHFFSRIARIAKCDFFPLSLKVRDPKNNMINGYLTSKKVLNCPLYEVQTLLCYDWAFKFTELLILIEHAAGDCFVQLLNTHPITKDILTHAAKYGHIEIIKSIGEHHGDLYLRLIGHGPIQAATQAGQGAAIKALSAYGADVDIEWEHFHKEEIRTVSPLQLACEAKITNAAIALLQAGACPDVEFLRCCERADLCMIKIFLEFSSCNVTGGLSLCFTSRKKHSSAGSCIELLLQNGANPNIGNSKGETYLHRVVEEANIDFVRLFCSHGADVEARDIKGKSPLYIAIKSTKSKVKRLEMVRILCDHGANILALGPKGVKTLFDHAAKSKKMTTLLKTIQMERKAT